MPAIITRTINLNGVVHKRGTDVADLVTPGELASLESAGVITRKSIAPEPNDDFDDDSDDEPELEGTDIGVLDTLADGVIEDLRAGGVNTIEEASAYLEKHSSFTPIKGIGKATSPDIVEALNEYLAGLDEAESQDAE